MCILFVIGWFMMKRKMNMISIALILALIVSACGSKPAADNENPAGASGGEVEKLTFTHLLGETTVNKNPQKVVVFDFGVLDSLDKLGIEIAGVPQANIPAYLSKYNDKKYVNVGSLKEPDFEKINAIKPDLIIISNRQAEAYDELTKIGPTLFMQVDQEQYVDSFKENMKSLGQIFGKEAEIEQELSSLIETIDQVNEQVKAEQKNALVVLVTGGKVSAYGPGSRFGVIHDVLGLQAVDESLDKAATHGTSISFEYIVEKNPDYLFVVDRDAVVSGGGDASAKDVIENELVKRTNAYKNGQIVYLDPNYWYLSGGDRKSVV